MNDNSCGCIFSVVDAYMNKSFTCTLEVHDGAHVDEVNGYTWGPTQGDDGYTLMRRAQLKTLEIRRQSSWSNFRKRYLNGPKR